MPLVNRPNGHIYYEVHGQSGPTLVMLRGLGRSVRHWLGFERDVAKHCRVVTIELRGIGRTTVPLGITHSIFDLGDDVAAVLDHLGVADAHVLGISLGGMAALAFGLAHPRRCRSLVAINTSIAGQRTARITPRALWAMTFGMIGELSGRRNLLHRKLVDVLTSPKFPLAARPPVVRQFADIARDDGLYIPTVLKQIVLASRFFVKRDLKTLRPPTLLVYGADDQFVPNANTRRIAHLIPNVRLQPIEGGGHELAVDQPEALLQAIRGWVDEQETQRPSFNHTQHTQTAAPRHALP